MARFLFLALAFCASAFAQAPNLAGDYTCHAYCPAGGEGARSRIEQNGNALVFVNEGGNRSSGAFVDAATVVASDWGFLRATVKGEDLLRANRTVWRKVRPAPSAGGVIDSLTIPNDKPVKVTSRIVLEKGKWYTLEASGVSSDWSDHRDGVDAVWCYAEWRCGKNGEAWQQLRIDDKGMSELNGATISFNPQHVYRVRVKGEGKPIVVYASDAQGSWSDNSGAFTLRIYGEGLGTIAETGRSYTSIPRASEAQTQPTSGSRFQDALKKSLQDALKATTK